MKQHTLANATITQTANNRYTIVFECPLPADIFGAWNMLMLADERNRWIDDVVIDDTRDGKVLFNFGTDGIVRGKVISINKPSELVHTWLWNDAPTSEVSWTFLRESDTSTLLKLTHQNVNEELTAHHAAHWHKTLSALLSYAEQNNLPAPDIDELLKRYSKTLV